MNELFSETLFQEADQQFFTVNKCLMHDLMISFSNLNPTISAFREILRTVGKPHDVVQRVGTGFQT